MLVITPIPACFVWPGIMLPGVLLSFIAEGCKFLFFDVSICNSQVWYPSGTESSPQPAASCTMGATGYYVISACCVFFVALVMICFKAPLKRVLKEDYGNPESANFMGAALPVDSGSNNEDPENQFPSSNLNAINPEEPYESDDDNFDLEYANTSMVMSMSRDESVLGGAASLGTFSGSGPSLTSTASSNVGKELHASVANASADKVTESDSDELISKCVTELAQSFKEGDGIEVVAESTNNKN